MLINLAHVYFSGETFPTMKESGLQADLIADLARRFRKTIGDVSISIVVSHKIDQRFLF